MAELKKVQVIDVGLKSKNIDKCAIVMLTTEQSEFLRQFADLQYSGADDNHYTNRPLHIVQDKSYIYIKYNAELDDGELEVQFYYGRCWYMDEASVVRANKGYSEDVYVASFKESYGVYIEGLGDIESYDQYFQYFGIDGVDISFALPQWDNKAYFFICESARQYIKYQAHNLRDPRVYTAFFGYGNNGEYEHFYNLLMDMGNALLEADEVQAAEAILNNE